jgi:hypothetical protein
MAMSVNIRAGPSSSKRQFNLVRCLKNMRIKSVYRNVKFCLQFVFNYECYHYLTLQNSITSRTVNSLCKVGLNLSLLKYAANILVCMVFQSKYL